MRNPMAANLPTEPALTGEATPRVRESGPIGHFAKIKLWLAKRFGERIEWNGPRVFGVGYRLGDTIYFDQPNANQ